MATVVQDRCRNCDGKGWRIRPHPNGGLVGEPCAWCQVGEPDRGPATFAAYSERTLSAWYSRSDDALAYTVLGLNGEAGEVAEVLKKAMRRGVVRLTPVETAAMLDEAGDVLYYLDRLCALLGSSLEAVAAANALKIAARQAERCRNGE